ncbi:hypothetical protein BN2476_230299 [Paraburkholderia piptadeniae]|uniref:Uncharacterized protein n=1 Tax=Paraburkholderia piptadeniae TaxID=1701573 RepID=A0A1N7RXW4_9BURK|nr:hypothetical protein BN2476_230299 [Paraburkholderia piptadeniae]
MPYRRVSRRCIWTSCGSGGPPPRYKALQHLWDSYWHDNLYLCNSVQTPCGTNSRCVDAGATALRGPPGNPERERF